MISSINFSPSAIKIFGSASSIAIVGINLYATNRDPESDEFSGWGTNQTGSGILVYAKVDTISKAILIEDNIINFFQNGIVLTGEAKFEDIEVRRNFILNSYSEISHSQGFYSINSSILLEDNLFDHNGWNQSGGKLVKAKKHGQATAHISRTMARNGADKLGLSPLRLPTG